MMRTMTATLGGQELELGCTFGAAADLAAKVGDPLAIVREAQLEAMMGTIGQVYNPKWTFTVANVPQILHIGMKAAGSKQTLVQVQDMVADAGFLEAKAVALDYIAAIVTPKAQEKADDADGDDAPGE